MKDILRRLSNRKLLRLLFIASFSTFIIFARHWFLQFTIVPPGSPATIEYGATFSPRFANELHLDWQKAYQEIITDLGIKRLRLPIYWDEIEPQPGQFDWGKLDWQLQTAQRLGAKTLLVVGHRVPRYPECFAPNWTQSLSDRDFYTALDRFIQTTVDRYHSHPALEAWQVENEPLAKIVGKTWGIGCREILDRVSEEVKLVRSRDPQHPIVTTYANAPWPADQLTQTLKFGSDIVGVTLLNKLFFRSPFYTGYVEMFNLGPIAPLSLTYQHWLTQRNQQRYWVTELQAEPWGENPAGIGAENPADAEKTMNPDRLSETISKATEAGISRIYLWGSEWWLFQHNTHKDERMLNFIKNQVKSQIQQSSPAAGTSEMSHHG